MVAARTAVKLNIVAVAVALLGGLLARAVDRVQEAAERTH